VSESCVGRGARAGLTQSRELGPSYHGERSDIRLPTRPLRTYQTGTPVPGQQFETCCTPGGPTTTEFLRDCHKHRFCAMRSSAVHRLAKPVGLLHEEDRGPCSNPTGFQKLQRVEECIEKNYRTQADCSRRRVDCPLMLGPRASQVCRRCAILRGSGQHQVRTRVDAPRTRP
jgi:hypothetical protein